MRCPGRGHARAGGGLQPLRRNHPHKDPAVVGQQDVDQCGGQEPSAGNDDGGLGQERILQQGFSSAQTPGRQVPRGTRSRFPSRCRSRWAGPLRCSCCDACRSSGSRSPRRLVRSDDRAGRSREARVHPCRVRAPGGTCSSLTVAPGGATKVNSESSGPRKGQAGEAGLESRFRLAPRRHRHPERHSGLRRRRRWPPSPAGSPAVRGTSSGCRPPARPLGRPGPLSPAVELSTTARNFAARSSGVGGIPAWLAWFGMSGAGTG